MFLDGTYTGIMGHEYLGASDMYFEVRYLEERSHGHRHLHAQFACIDLEDLSTATMCPH